MTRNDPTPGYEAIVSGPLTFAGVDQGIDFTGTGSVLALGEGIVERVVHSGSGWPGKGALLVYRLTAGPGKGKHVYVAEDYTIAAGLRRGSKLQAGQVIGTVHSSYPGIEIGWASASGSPIAPLYPNPHGPKQAGREFDAFVRGLAHAVGTTLGAPADGSNATLAAQAGAAGCATMLVYLALCVGEVIGIFTLVVGRPPW